MGHETTHVCSTVVHRGTPPVGSWAALLGGLYATAVPDPAHRCAWAAPRADCPAAQLCAPERPHYQPCLAHPWIGRRAGPVQTPQAHPPGARRRIVTGTAARTAPRFWQTTQHLDTGLRRRGLVGAGADAPPGQPRDRPPGAQAAGRELAAGQGLDHQPRSPRRVQKKHRNRLMRLAAQPPDWVLGFADETWWRRLPQPPLHSGTAGQPRHLVEQASPKGEMVPKAFAC
jgi:hypothetical protein